MIKEVSNYKISLDLKLVIKSYIKGRILDVGTGDGSKLDFILKGSDFKEVLALEPDSEKIVFAKRLFKNDGRVEFINTDVEHLSKDMGKFDVITMFEVIEHISLNSLDDCIERLKELLVEDGIIIISSPNRYIYRMICNLNLEKPEPTHLSEMNWLDLRRFMKKYFKEQCLKGELPGMSIVRKFPVFYDLFSLLNKNFAHPAVSRAVYWIGKK